MTPGCWCPGISILLNQNATSMKHTPGARNEHLLYPSLNESPDILSKESVPYSFERSKEMPEKRDSFERSEKGLQRQNSSTAHMEAPRQFHSFQRSREMRENPTPSEGVQGRFSEKVTSGEVSCDRGGTFDDSHTFKFTTPGF